MPLVQLWERKPEKRVSDGVRKKKSLQQSKSVSAEKSAKNVIKEVNDGRKGVPVTGYQREESIQSNRTFALYHLAGFHVSCSFRVTVVAAHWTFFALQFHLSIWSFLAMLCTCPEQIGCCYLLSLVPSLLLISI